MPVQERLFNAACGISFLSWCFLGLWQDWSTYEALSIPRVSVALLNFFVGLLILARSPELIAPGRLELATSLGSLVSCGLLFKLAQPLGEWSMGLGIYFAIGALFASVSFLYLGKSFAVLPSLRQVKSNGPYRLIRHPAYLGELNMVVACALVVNSLVTWIICALAISLTIVRIEFEERLLRQSSDYRAYSGAVTKKLLPGVW